jgi:hypothetical protein
LLLAIAVVAANGLYVAAFLGPLHKARRVPETDQDRYIAMSMASPGRATDELAREAPFCWRIGVPFLVNRLVARGGLDRDLAFYAISALGLVLFLATLHAFMLRIGLDAAESALGLLLAGLTPGVVRWNLYQYWLADPLALFLTTLGLLLSRFGPALALPLVGGLAALVRENYVAVLPFHLVDGWRRDGPRVLRAFLPHALAFAAVTLAVRRLIAPADRYDVLAVAADSLGFRWRHLLDNQLYFMTLGSLGVLVPLLLAFPRRVAGALRAHPAEAVFAALIVGSLAVANNTDRLLAYALPVALPAALLNLRGLVQSGWSRPALFAAVLALQGLLYQQARFARFQGASVYQPTSWPVVIAMGLFWLALLAWPRRGHA